MHRRLARPCALLALALAGPLAAQPSRPAAAHPVATFFHAGIDAFNRHALDEFTAQFADDIAMYTPTGWLRGHAAVRARFDTTFRQFPRVRMEIDSLAVHDVAPGVATVSFRWRTYPHGSGAAFHGVGSGVYVRRGTRWVEVLEHETIARVDSALTRARPGSR